MIAGTKTWILRSTLPPELVAAMANPLPLPMFDASGNASTQDTDEPTDSGALIRWEKADGTASGNLGLLGVRTVVLCLMMCLGRVIQDGKSIQPLLFAARPKTRSLSTWYQTLILRFKQIICTRCSGDSTSSGILFCPTHRRTARSHL